MQRNKKFIIFGFVWAIVFAGISFYWALGDMLGAVFMHCFSPTWKMILYLNLK